MKKITNKRWLLLSSLVLVMVLATTGFAVSGFKGQFSKYHGKEFVKGKILSHMDYTMQELKISPAQQVKYSAIRDKMSMAMDQCVTRHDTFKNAIHSEMGKPYPDLKALAGNVKNEIRTMPDVVTVQIDYMVEVYDILNKQQQAELVKMIKERMAEKNCS